MGSAVALCLVIYHLAQNRALKQANFLVQSRVHSVPAHFRRRTVYPHHTKRFPTKKAFKIRRLHSNDWHHLTCYKLSTLVCYESVSGKTDVILKLDNDSEC
jgi:hypothetical protein